MHNNHKQQNHIKWEKIYVWSGGEKKKKRECIATAAKFKDRKMISVHRSANCSGIEFKIELPRFQINKMQNENEEREREKKCQPNYAQIHLR